MYLYFNEKGILKEIVNDEAIRLGNNDLNHIYIYWENAPEVDSMWATFELPNGETTNELNYSHIKVKKTIPYSKTRDLKFFKDYVSYDFFDIAIPDGVNGDGEVVGLNVLAQDGLVSASIRFVLTLGQAITTLGLITFNVEKSVIQADLGINQSQFDYLLKHMLLNTTDSIVYRVDNINSVDPTKLPNNAIITTTNENGDVDFYKVQSGTLFNISQLQYVFYEVGKTTFASNQLYYGRMRTPTNLFSSGTFFIGWANGSTYYFIVNGRLYTTDQNLSYASVSVNEDYATKLTTLTNLLVTDNMKVNGKLYLGEADENNEVLKRSEIVSMYEEYTNGEIDTLRDEMINYTDDEINGLKDGEGKIRSDLLPSYVDDVLEFGSYTDFPLIGERGKIYLALDTNNTYRWSGSEYFQLNIKGVEELERVVPTDIVVDGNAIKLYHDNTEITGQDNPVRFKTINGESIIGSDDIVLELSHYVKEITPKTAVSGYFTEEEVYQLKNHNAKITRNGELYNYSDQSDDEYLTFIHASIDTSKSDRPAVMRAVRINMETYFWELISYDLANNDGYYEEMRVGNADNLHSPDSVSDELPFAFRPTAGDLNIQNSNAVIRSVRGNTIVWNQLFNINQYIYTSTTQSIEVNQATNTIKVVALQDKTSLVIYPYDDITITGHKYYVSLNVLSNKSFTKTYLYLNENSRISYEQTFNANTKYYFNGIITATGDAQKTILRIDGTFNTNDYVEFSNYVIVDLTEMFGEGNEPTSVDEFVSMFPNLTYGYNEGELRNVNISGLNSVGLNAFDGILEYGQITSAGVENTYTKGLKSKNYIKVIPNREYVIRVFNFDLWTGIFAVEYDENKNFIKRYQWASPTYTGVTPGIWKMSDNTHYLRFFFYNNEIVYNEIPTDAKICVHLAHSGYLNGVYRPYESHYLAINTSQYFPDGMKRAGNAFDELTPDTAIKRIGSVDLGTLVPYDLTTTGIVKYRKTQIPSMGAPYNSTSNLLIAGYKTTSLKNVNNMVEDLTISASDTNEYQGLYIYNSSFAGKTKAEIQQALNGVIVYFELADYEITPTPKQTWEYQADDFGTEEFIQVGNTAPTSHLTIYTPNLRDDVRTLPTNYISVNSFASFASALASAVGVKITTTWNATKKQYEFTITK